MAKMEKYTRGRKSSTSYSVTTKMYKYFWKKKKKKKGSLKILFWISNDPFSHLTSRNIGSIVTHGENCHSWQLHSVFWLPHMCICVKTRNTLASQTTHGGTPCSWVGWTTFWERRGQTESKFLWCCFSASDVFQNLPDSQRLAHTKAWCCLVKAHQFFFFCLWQNRQQLQRHSAVCVSFLSWAV